MLKPTSGIWNYSIGSDKIIMEARQSVHSFGAVGLPTATDSLVKPALKLSYLQLFHIAKSLVWNSRFMSISLLNIDRKQL